MYYLFDFILLISLYFLIFHKKWKKGPKRILLINSIMYVYIIMVIFVTLMPFTIQLVLGGTNNLFMETANFIPFRDLMLNYNGAVKEIILNIIMMIPFGFLYPIISKKSASKVIIMTFLFSLTIECLQLMSARWGGLFSRSFDVTDLITNTTGGLIGYILYAALRPFINKLLKGV